MRVRGSVFQVLRLVGSSPAHFPRVPARVLDDFEFMV